MLMVALLQAPDSMVVVPRSSLSPAQLEQLTTDQRTRNYGKWVGLGKEIGEAVNGSLSAITTQANNFANTGVGKLTVFLVVWKVIGRQFTQLVFGTGFFIVAMILWIWTYKTKAKDHSVLVKVNADKSKEYRLIMGDSDWAGALWGIFFVIAILTCMIIFIH